MTKLLTSATAARVCRRRDRAREREASISRGNCVRRCKSGSVIHGLRDPFPLSLRLVRTRVSPADRTSRNHAVEQIRKGDGEEAGRWCLSPEGEVRESRDALSNPPSGAAVTNALRMRVLQPSTCASAYVCPQATCLSPHAVDPSSYIRAHAVAKVALRPLGSRLARLRLTELDKSWRQRRALRPLASLRSSSQRCKLRPSGRTDHGTWDPRQQLLHRRRRRRRPPTPRSGTRPSSRVATEFCCSAPS